MTKDQLIAALRLELTKCLAELLADSGYDRQDEIRAALALQSGAERAERR